MTLRSQNFFLWLCICFCGLSLTDSGRPVVTSIVFITRLSQFEQILVSFVRERASQLPPQFVNFASSVEEEYARTYDNAFSFMDFPVNQYRLIRRFSYDWPLWREQLRIPKHVDRTSHASLSSVSEFLTFYNQQSVMHGEIDKFDAHFDLHAAAATITRLHLLYRNETGLLPNDQPTGCPPLSVIELLELSATAFRTDDIYYAAHWMASFVDRMKRHLPYSPVMSMIAYVLKHSDIYGRPDHHHRTLAVDNGVERLKILTEIMTKYPKSLQEFYHVLDRDSETQVCRSSTDRIKHGNGNHCFIFHTPRAPYAPFKYEILHRNPYIAVVHNFMPHDVARSTIAAAVTIGSDVIKVMLNPLVAAGRRIVRIFANRRLSERTVFDHYHPLNAWLDLRVEHATLLQPHSQPMPHGVRDGDLNQILHYGLSGHFKAHHDYYHRDSYVMKNGNRVASVFVYLSDVHSGGHTAFPLLNVSVPPRAGSALVLFNLDPLNGTRLPDTLHTGCPMNIGKKWLITRFINSHFKTGYLRPVVK